MIRKVAHILQAKVRYEVGMDLASTNTSSVSVACILHVDLDSRFWIQDFGFKILDPRKWIGKRGQMGAR